MLGPLAVTPGVTYVRVYHRPSDIHFLHHHGASSSLTPCEAGVWLNGVLALHPVHHVKVTHLVLPCRPNHCCPAKTTLSKISPSS